jgi:hypothetical protein
VSLGALFCCWCSGGRSLFLACAHNTSKCQQTGDRAIAQLHAVDCTGQTHDHVLGGRRVPRRCQPPSSTHCPATVTLAQLYSHRQALAVLECHKFWNERLPCWHLGHLGLHIPSPACIPHSPSCRIFCCCALTAVAASAAAAADCRTIEDHDTLFVLAEVAHFVGIGLLGFKMYSKRSAAGVQQQLPVCSRIARR